MNLGLNLNPRRAYPVAILVELIVVGLALSGAPRAGVAAPEQAYIEATISRGAAIAAQPHLLVDLGKNGALTFRNEADPARRLGLKFRIDQADSPDAGLTATVTGLVDGGAGVDQTLHFTRAEGTEASFQGGGYTWRVKVDFVSEDFMRRRAQRGPAPAPSSPAR